MKHDMLGNCWSNAAAYSCKECGDDIMCDVCHLHDEPRGECSECKPCAACTEEESVKHDKEKCKTDACPACVNDFGSP